MARLLPSLFSLSFHYVIVTTVFISIPRLTHSLTLDADIEVLSALKRGLDPNSISPTSYLNTWDFNLDPCQVMGGQFLGILCSNPLDNSSQRITALDLDGIGYDGFLTPSIGNLTELTILSLDKNKFRGPFPGTLSNLKKLTRLSLVDNYFTGPIPRAIPSLMNLEYIDLSGNSFSGSIPTNISGLRSLTYLSLSNNGLAGKIPDLRGLWQLQTLDLGTNQFHGNLPILPVRLRSLSLSHNLFSGHISPVKRFTHLRRLDISDNRFSDTISKDILLLPRLVHLNVSLNRFTAIETVNFFGEETPLEVLDAENNHFHGNLPVNLVTIRNLGTLNLAHNLFSGPIPSEFGDKPGRPWRALYLNNNFLSGNLPPEFIHHATRVTISLANNCLRCPRDIPLCRGGQRSASECGEKNNRGG